jgi:hypothetical protein
MITESDRLASALTTAAALWPEAKGDKGVLLRRILEAGIETVETRQAEEAERFRAAVSLAAGSMTGVWPVTWREELRHEWPA